MSDPKQGDLRIWWIPQVPMQPFEWLVPDLVTASSMLDLLAKYDAFQFEHNIKPDYCNAGGLSVYDATANDWFDWDDDEDGRSFDEVRTDPAELAAAEAKRNAQ